VKTHTKDYFENEVRKLFENKGYKTQQLSGLGMECDSVVYYDGIQIGKIEKKLKHWLGFIPYKISSIKSLGFFTIKDEKKQFKIELTSNGEKNNEILMNAIDKDFLERKNIGLELIITSE